MWNRPPSSKGLRTINTDTSIQNAEYVRRAGYEEVKDSVVEEITALSRVPKVGERERGLLKRCQSIEAALSIA